MAQLIINLEENDILWIISAAARENSSVSEWVKERVVLAGRGPRTPRRAGLPLAGAASRAPDTDPFPDEGGAAFP